MVRRWAPLGLILVLLLGTFGVGATATKPAQLNVGVVAGVEIRGLKAIAPLWQKATGVKLNLIAYPYPSLYEKMVTAFQANSATFDVVMLDDPWMPKFGAEGWLTPLDAAPYNFTRDSDIFPVVYDLGSWPPPDRPRITQVPARAA